MGLEQAIDLAPVSESVTRLFPKGCTEKASP